MYKVINRLDLISDNSGGIKWDLLIIGEGKKKLTTIL